MMTPAAEPVSGLAAAALDLLPQSLYIVDRNLTVVAWNARREQGPLGLSRVRALGRNLRDVLSPRGFDSVLPAFNHVLDTGKPFEEKRTTRDGRRTYRVRRLPIRGGGAVTHVVTLSDEVHEGSVRVDPSGSIAPRRGLRGMHAVLRCVLDSRRPVPVHAPEVVAPPLALPTPRDLAVHGIVPVCAWCKKIRDQRGEWQQVEVYLATRSDSTFTHGICDDCAGRAHLAGQDMVCVPRPSARPGRPTTL